MSHGQKGPNSSEEKFFGDEQKGGRNPGTGNITQECGQDSIKSRAMREKQLYPERVNNMRMQFAWASDILAFMWIFIILYILMCHGIGNLQLYLFKCIAWAASASLATSVLVYSACMCIYSRHQYRSNFLPERGHVADLWRNPAPHISFFLSATSGVAVFFFVHLFVKNQNNYEFTRLTDSVLITLITSTTVSVLGILGAFMWWLFPRKEKTH